MTDCSINLAGVIMPVKVKAGTSIAVTIILKNKNFLAEIPTRKFFISLVGEKRYNILIPINIKELERKMKKDFAVNVFIPQDTCAGIYELGFWIPDENDINNTSLNIRFATGSRWDNSTGINILYTGFEVVS